MTSKGPMPQPDIVADLYNVEWTGDCGLSGNVYFDTLGRYKDGQHITLLEVRKPISGRMAHCKGGHLYRIVSWKGEEVGGEEVTAPRQFRSPRGLTGIAQREAQPSGLTAAMDFMAGYNPESMLRPAVDEPSLEYATERLLRAIEGMHKDDQLREGLQDTPARMKKAWEFWVSGYSMNAADILKVFEDGADGYDEMVVVKDIPLYSHCEHHLAAIFGTATVAYIPNGRIVGLSKLSRLVDMHARRLQVQERLTNDVAEDLWTHLKPKGVGVIVKARHMCMESRGVCQQGHHTLTSALRGAIKEEPAVRAEFLNLAQ